MSRTLRERPRDDVVGGVVAVVVANLTLVVGIALAPELAPVLFLAAVVLATLGTRLARSLVERPQRGMLLLAALLPFDGLLIVAPLPEVAAGWKEALTGLILAATFVAPKQARGASDRHPPSWWPVLVAFFVLAVLSAAIRHDFQGLVGLKVGFFAALIAIAVWRCPPNRIERDHLVTILMATGVITAAFGILQQVIGGDRLASLGWEFNSNIRFAGGVLRSFSTFTDNFPFALFLMMVLLIGLPCGFVDPQRRRSRLFFMSIPVILLALGLTVTRAAWIGLVVGLLYLGAVNFRVVLSFLVRAVIVGVLVLVFFSGFATSFLSERSTNERLDLWEENFSQIIANPLGLGIGETGSAAAKINDIQGSGPATFQPDNYYFKTTLELGVIGLWLFILLMVTAFSSAHSGARGLSPPDSALASGVAAMILAAVAVSTSATYFEVFPMDFYFWLLLAVVATCVRESR